MSIRISGMLNESIVNGPGFRFVLFTQGCPHGCPGCHNPQTHNPCGGTLVDSEDVLKAIRQNPLLSGITFSGGEPFMQAGPLADLAARLHAMGKTVVTYSGYTYEQLLEKSRSDRDIRLLLEETDCLIDGPFILERLSPALPFRGSDNQQIRYLKPGSVLPAAG